MQVVAAHPDVAETQVQSRTRTDDPKVVADYNSRLQRALKKMVFSGGCNAWYTDDKDHNFTLWPYSAARFIFELRAVKKRDFRATG